MNEVGTMNTRWDALKWVFVVILVAAGLWANYHYIQLDWSLRLAGWIVLAIIIVLVASQTALGQRSWNFAKQARQELRKVVWPTRQETVQTTVIIIAMVILMALILWAIDSFLLWLLSLLTGQRG